MRDKKSGSKNIVKILIPVLCFILVFSACSGGCSKNKGTDTQTVENSSSTTATEKAITTTEQTAETTGAAATTVVKTTLATTKAVAVTTKKATTAKATTTVAVTAKGTRITGFENEMLARVNKERAANGKSALTLNTELCNNAAVRAQEIITSFSHTRPNGTDCFTAVTVKYYAVGENLAWGYPNVEKVMDAWMASEGHKDNILYDGFEQAGFGCYYYEGYYYWSQFFIQLPA